MMNSPRSCAVAFPSQRNCATSEISATPSVTHYTQINRKPASIRELRAQLLAQQARNEASTIQASEPVKVAHEIAPVAQLRSCVSYVVNSATDLVREFMEVDGLSLKEAQELAAVSVTPRSSTDWVALVQELDGLIDRYCQACKLSKDTQIHIREVRRRQSLVSIPLAVKWFRRELAAIEGKPAP